MVSYLVSGSLASILLLRERNRSNYSFVDVFTVIEKYTFKMKAY